MKKFARLSVVFLLALVISVVTFSALAGEEERVYVVKHGDTLGEIAWTLGVTRADLVAWNPETGIHRIHIGQELRYRVTVPEPTPVITTGTTGSSWMDESSGQTAKSPVTPQLALSWWERGYAVASFLFFTTIFLLGVWALYVFMTDPVEKSRSRASSTSKEAEKNTERVKVVRLAFGEEKYVFYAEIACDGRYKSLQEVLPGQFLTYGSEGDLKRSVKSSLRKDPALVERLLTEGRLRKID